MFRDNFKDSSEWIRKIPQISPKNRPAFKKQNLVYKAKVDSNSIEKNLKSPPGPLRKRKSSFTYFTHGDKHPVATTESKIFKTIHLIG